jgi:hypothetical protein
MPSPSILDLIALIIFDEEYKVSSSSFCLRNFLHSCVLFSYICIHTSAVCSQIFPVNVFNSVAVITTGHNIAVLRYSQID